MVRKFVVLCAAIAAICAYSFASVPAYSVPLTSLKAGTGITLVGKGHGGGKHGGGKNWSKHDGGKNWSKHGGGKNWSKHGGNKKWSGKGYGGNKWKSRGNWYAGQRHRGYWRNGIFITLPFVVGGQCYDYLDWRDGAPQPGWYWVC